MLNEEKTNCRADMTKRRTTRIPSTDSHHSRPHGGAVQYSDEESEETHIDTVGDNEDIDNGDVDDDEDEDEDDDEDEVIEIKTPSRRSSSSSLNDAAAAAFMPSTEIRISDEFVQEQLGQKPPVQAPHEETEGESSESGAGTGSGSSSADKPLEFLARSLSWRVRTRTRARYDRTHRPDHIEGRGERRGGAGAWYD